MLSERLATLGHALAPEVASRLALALNHLLRTEPVAARRLVPHEGRCVEMRLDRGTPIGLAPPLRFEITRAGLLDADLDTGARGRPADVVLLIDADPLRATSALLHGTPPPMSIEGAPALAAEVQWLVENLRWDLEDDLERLIGPVAAHAGVRAGASLAAAARDAFDALASIRPRGPG